MCAQRSPPPGSPGELFAPPPAPARADLAASVEGTLSHIVFRNEINHFLIARLDVEGQSWPLTIRGILPGIARGERVRVHGRWVEDPRYGRQLQVEGFLPVSADTPRAVERQLAGDSVRGIGPVFARRLVDFFGADVLDVLDNHPERLREVPGIGSVRARRIAETWQQRRAWRDAILFLQGLGLPLGLAGRVHRRYAERTVQLVRENPYRMAVDVPGVGFLTADRVATALGIAPDSTYRLRAGLLYALGRATDEGHCFLPREQLAERASALLSLPWERLEPVLAALVEERALHTEAASDGLRVWLPEMLALEQQVVTRLGALLRQPPPAVSIDIPAALRWAQERSGITLSPAQRDALAGALLGKVVIVTGGPGTGKTTLVRALLDIWERKGVRVRLAAPTGRAARRMEEASSRKASTLHRLLEFSPKEGRFLRDRDRPVDGDVLIVDEVSMVDLPLMAALLAGLPDAARLVLVGDSDQLPSVGPGRVLADLLESGAVPICRLDVVFRQDEAGLIVRNAHRILRGETPLSSERPDGDFFLVPRDEPEEALRTVLHIVTERLPQRFGLDPREQVQVLVPMRRGACGAESLNVALRQAIVGTAETPETQAAGEAPAASAGRPRAGDRVIQVRNDYEREVWNGDVGLATGPGPEGRGLRVRFDAAREVDYAPEDVDDLEPAWAITVHKSQGSEYPAVVIPLLTQHYRMLQRNLLYTAVTRGKRVVVLVASRRALAVALRNAESERRFTGLAGRLAAAR